MADQLSKIQESVNQLAIQMYSCLRHIDTMHPPAPIDGQPFITAADSGATQPSNTNPNTPVASQAPDLTQQGEDDLKQDAAPSPEAFEKDLQELAQDLVVKEQHIELLVKNLPGLGNSQEAQEQRIRDLQVALQEIDEEISRAREEKDDLVSRVEQSIMSIKRI